MPRLSDGQKMMWMLRGPDGIDGNLQTAIRSVFKPDRTRQAGREVAMHLAFGRARAYGPPTDNVGYVLRRDDVQIFHAGRNPGVVEFEQELAPDLQSIIDSKTAIQVRIIDQPLPTHGRARLLEVHAHDDKQFRLVEIFLRFQFPRVLERRFRIVNRARPDYDEQPVIGAVQNAMN